MGYKDIVPGKYSAKAINGTLGAHGQKGTMAVTVLFKITQAGPMQGEEITFISYFTDTVGKDGKTPAMRTFETLRLLGFDENRDVPVGPDGVQRFDQTYLADKEVEIDIQAEAYENKTQMKVKWVNELGGGQFGGLNPVAGSKIDSNFLKAGIAAAKARLGAAPTQNQTPPSGKTPF